MLSVDVTSAPGAPRVNSAAKVFRLGAAIFLIIIYANAERRLNLGERAAPSVTDTR